MSTLLLVPLLVLASGLGRSPLQEGDPVMPPDQGEVVTTASGLKYSVLAPGDGERPPPEARVTVQYSGWLLDGKLFDSSKRSGKPFSFLLGKRQVIRGWDEGVALMPKGSRYRFTIPPDLAYGPTGRPPRIPPGATLVFEIELLDFKPIPVFRPANPEAQKELDKGLVYEVLEPGSGEPPKKGQLCEVDFALFNASGKMLECTAMRGQSIRETCGEAQFDFMDELLQHMPPGARWRVEVPPELAFGASDKGPDLPANSRTVWEITLLSVRDPLPVPEFHPLDPAKTQKTASGLAYEVLKPGTGAKPTPQQEVTVHYAGWLTDGKLFDASYRRGEPATFPLGGVIPGWTEGLQLMAEGAVYRFEIPSNLAYGKRGFPPDIPPDATLIFQVELLRVGG